LKRLAKRARNWIAITDGVKGEGRRLFERVAEMDLEGIVAKRLADPYAPGSTIWWKVLNRSYSQKEGRSELFERG
jgi:ATP-dependent DNA ligase